MRCVGRKWGKLSADNFPYIGKAIAYLITCQNAPKKLILESMAKKELPRYDFSRTDPNTDLTRLLKGFARETFEVNGGRIYRVSLHDACSSVL